MDDVRAIDRPRTAADLSGVNLYRADRSLAELLDLHLPADLRAHMEPHLDRLGGLAGGRLDALARAADRAPPVLHHRDRHGRDRPSIDYHPAYTAMEAIGFGEFGLAALSHRAGVLDWPAPLPPIVKYALTYLFAQAEFGLLCPISMTDSLTRVIRRHGDPALLERVLPGLLTQDLDALTQGAMFMTEKAGGSDVGATETVAREQDGVWRLHGEKWFCSNAGAELALVLARPEGAGPGTRGLGLFLLPRTLDDGSPNRVRMVRLKDKLGTRSMASGEAVLDGAVAWPIGRLDRGFVQMAEMVNASRLSNAVRAAGLMRRAFLEARQVCRDRSAFGQSLDALPLQRRQLMKLLLPAEQALSMAMAAALALARGDGGDEAAAKETRLLTPLLKFRACRDARKVAGDAMEVRGGTGYIEEFVEPRLLRDSHLGSIWEGTSNIVAIDAIGRAVGRVGAEAALAQSLAGRVAACAGLHAGFSKRLQDRLDRALSLARAVAGEGDERRMRHAASTLYHAVSAVFLAEEGVRLGASGHRRVLLAALVLRHRLSARDPLADAGDDALDRIAEAACLDGAAVGRIDLAEALDALA